MPKAITLLAAACFSAVACGAETAPAAAVPLAPYTVTEALVGEFYLKTDGQPARRVWLISARGNPNARPFPKFVGPGLGSGDEVVRIAGRPVAEMPPGEALRLLYQTMSLARNRTIDIDVSSPGAKELRKVTLRFVPAPPGTKP